MIPYFCFLLLAILAIRSLILFLFESKSWFSRIFDLLLAVLFAAAAFLLSLFTKLSFTQEIPQLMALCLLIAAPVSLLITLRLRKTYSRGAAAMVTKTFFLLLLICLSLMVVMMSGFLNLAEDEPILKVVMTGNQRQEFVEWKPPEDSLQRQNLTAYEVLIETPDGKPLSQLFVYGDQVAVKAKILRFLPILNLLGFHNLCKIEYVHNGYTTAARFNLYPHRAQEISLSHPWVKPYQDAFWSFWEGSYYQESSHWWVKSATLESSYFPLVYADGTSFHGSYYLTVTPGGLSGVPLP